MPELYCKFKKQLKGKCHEIFDLCLFLMILTPLDPLLIWLSNFWIGYLLVRKSPRCHRGAAKSDSAGNWQEIFVRFFLSLFTHVFGPMIHAGTVSKTDVHLNSWAWPWGRKSTWRWVSVFPPGHSYRHAPPGRTQTYRSSCTRQHLTQKTTDSIIVVSAVYSEGTDPA